MITIEQFTENTLEITVHDTLALSDFSNLENVADDLIESKGTLNLILNASNFNGWKGIEVAEKHFKFVKDHHKK